MTEAFLVPIKGVEIPFDDTVNQTKTVFLIFLFCFILHLIRSMFFIKIIKTNILWHLIIREGQICFIINNNEDV